MVRSDWVIGILGGGQLAKMSAQAARKFSFKVKVLDPTPDSPASQVAEQVVGSFKDPHTVKKFAEKCDIITFDIEHVDISLIKELSDTKRIIPTPQILEIIQNKYEQRKLYQKAGLPVPHFQLLEDPKELEKYLPVVQKSITGGYDGRGTVVLKSKEDIVNALTGPSFIEEYLELEKELAVIVVKNERGEYVLYEPVEMIFHPEGNLLDYLLCPTDLEEKIVREAKELALEAVNCLGGIGLFAVELFLDKKGKLYLNEIAPRPHNSGHHTIEACYTSQFEQHIRVITGLPLGSPKLLSPAVMFNLLGEPNYYGKPIYEGLEEALKTPGVSVHIYGKKETFPLRKMGHVTVLAETVKEALKIAKKLKEILKVKGEVRK
ncbi:MAG: 5-(carboxyamino)imidazole ribonucleotide synthase [Caldimicrobium sp.]